MDVRVDVPQLLTRLLAMGLLNKTVVQSATLTGGIVLGVETWGKHRTVAQVKKRTLWLLKHRTPPQPPQTSTPTRPRPRTAPTPAPPPVATSRRTVQGRTMVVAMKFDDPEALCSLNGIHDGSRCRCAFYLPACSLWTLVRCHLSHLPSHMYDARTHTGDQGWWGHACAQLDLLPAVHATPGYHNASMPSWYGSIVEEAGVHYMFAVARATVAGPPYDDYFTNSKLVRLVSTGGGGGRGGGGGEGTAPEGPYVLQGTVLPRFAHEVCRCIDDLARARCQPVTLLSAAQTRAHVVSQSCRAAAAACKRPPPRLLGDCVVYACG